MKYVGIDLGTTNSAICSYDGENIHLYKSSDQKDVTPSAIYIGRRGEKHIGERAYNLAAHSPDNAATKFKRMMGTSTPINLSAVNLVMTPEECSAEILKVCFGSLPEDIRNNPDTGTVITVPAAFNQMQKDATMAAAEMAGIGKVALMQEPVAAVMSVMRQHKGDGIFMIYDLGGGTLDIAIAESISGKVRVQAHGGIAMCGGTDFDRIILDNVVKPWFFDNFDLPEDFAFNPKYKKVIRLALWATEKAKIELSTKNEAVITLPESEIGLKDESGEEIYLDVELNRVTLDELIAEKVQDSIQSARETIEKAQLNQNDIGRIVFIGGPTNYKPMCNKVAFELGIAASADVNPMTAVAEGAAVFAESIDWNSESRGRKNSRGTLGSDGQLDLSFNFIARTPSATAKIAVKLGGLEISGAEFQINNLDDGTDYGRMPLKNGATVDVNLRKSGDNTFKIFVFDETGGLLNIGNNKIVITKTAATIDAIPASSSIGIEVSEKGRSELVYLVREGDPLPKKGAIPFIALESVRAGSANVLHFNLWEGEIKDPITGNRFIGELAIKGSDFDEGVISQGAELICNYEVKDSGQINLELSIPSIGAAFPNKNLYSREVGGENFLTASKQIIEEVNDVRGKVDSIAAKVNDPKLDQALRKLDQASSLRDGETDPDTAKQAQDNVLEAKKLLADVRQSNKKLMRQMDLDSCLGFFNEVVRQHARATEASAFDNLVRTAQRAIDSNSGDFENHLDQLRQRNFEILWRQDFFVVDRFKLMAQEPWNFIDQGQHTELVALGVEAIKADDIEKLRHIMGQLYSIRISSGGDDDMIASTNIMRG